MLYVRVLHPYDGRKYLYMGLNFLKLEVNVWPAAQKVAVCFLLECY